MDKLQANIKVSGNVTRRVYDLDGNPDYTYWDSIHNIETTNGLQEIAKVLMGEATVSYIGVGSGITPPTVGDLDLEVEIPSRKVITESTRTGAICLYSVFFGTTDCNGNWNEAILATGASGNNIIARALFNSTFPKDSTKRAYVDWTISIAGG